MPKNRTFWFGAVWALGLVLAPAIHAQEPQPPANFAASDSATPGQAADPFSSAMHDSYQQLSKGQLDAALASVNTALRLKPKSTDAYVLRGSIYAQQKQWSKAEQDYGAAQGLAPGSIMVKFNLAEVKFLQKAYDAARPRFFALQSDKELGDLAAFKVFLCDLVGGHEDVAARELDAFNKADGNPSYYFSNAVWALVHHKPDDARSWLVSATKIYGDNPYKLQSYAVSLKNLGYLPIPPPPGGQ